MPKEIRTATLKRTIALSSQTKHLEFVAPGMERFDFSAGQFVSLVAPKPDGKEITRAYSVASPPRGDNTFDLCLNRVQDGFMSNYLCGLQEGAEVRWHGPYGGFTLRRPLRDAMFIATGTGIAPIRGMLQWLFAEPERNRDREFWLFYGTRFRDSIYYADEFTRLEQQNPNFHYIVTLSRGGGDWPGLTGYVQDHVQHIAEERRDMHAYICGLNAMVSANRELLARLGWDRTSIVYERYD